MVSPFGMTVSHFTISSSSAGLLTLDQQFPFLHGTSKGNFLFVNDIPVVPCHGKAEVLGTGIHAKCYLLGCSTGLIE